MEKQNKKTQKIINQIVESIKSPVTVGLFISIVFLAVAQKYYYMIDNIDELSKQQSLIFKVFQFLDQKTLDFRFKLRGPQEVKQKVAILAVDDKSLNEIGRWPWGRDKMATLIDHLMAYNPKAVGFDIVFSEPQESEAIASLNSLKSKYPNLPQDVQSTINSEIIQRNPDQQFAQIIEKYSDKLIMGAFFEPAPYNFHPYQEKCVQQVIKRSDNGLVTDKEETPPIVLVEGDKFIQAQESLAPYLDQVFNQVTKAKKEQIIQNKFLKKSEDDLNNQEKIQLKNIIENELYSYCNNWLSKDDPYLPYFKENWKNIFKDFSLFQTLSFEDSMFAFSYESLINPLTERGHWTVNIPDFVEKTKHTAFFNAELDTDGVLRSSALLHRSGDSFLYSLAMKTYLVAQKQQAIITTDQDPDYPRQRKVKEFKVLIDPENSEDHFLVPVDKRGYLTINYAGPQQMIPHLSASDLFNDNPKVQISKRYWDDKNKVFNFKTEQVDKKEFIQDTIFIIGATAIGVYDLRTVPFEANYPGVEVHANIINNLLEKNFLIRNREEAKIILASILVIGVILSFLLSHLSAIPGLLITILLSAVLAFIDRFIFAKGLLVTIVFPISQILLIYISMTFYKYLTEERKKKYLRSTFSKYVSPAIVDEILKDPENIELGGHKEHMTVMFSDVRGFTTISEKLDPQVLTKILNDYLTPMTQIVFNNQGTLDKYMGDAIMAFFGAPIHFNEHAEWACRCALQSIEKLKELQKVFKVEFEKRGIVDQELDIGIGLNSGDMNVGNMGSDIVRSYTVMGDAVNLASRLEGINKQYGTRIIISEFTHDLVKNKFVSREVDWVKVKGKNKPIKIYELMCEGTPPTEMADLINTFNKGYESYHLQKWSESLEFFKRCLQIKPEDPVSLLYVERCEDYLQNPPPSDWDGVFTMKTK